jgi:NADH-quinone oxidoreductase subunit K
MVNFNAAIFVALLLFGIGTLGFLIRRNAIVVFMSVELMLNAVNLLLVTFSRIRVDLDGQVMAFFVMAVAAAEAAVGLAIIIAVFRKMRNIDLDKASLLRS